MPLHIRQGLGLIALGALVAFFGLIWVANLFGVADEQVRRIAANPYNRRIARLLGKEDRLQRDPTNFPGMQLGRFVSGYGFMLFGLVFAIAGTVTLASGQD
jgi:hypothetical protein